MRKKNFVVALADEDAVSIMMKSRVEPTQKVATAKVTKWRAYATALQYTGPVAWHVHEGFTLKRDARNIGLCHNRLRHVQQWHIENDAPTNEGLVFWVPSLAPGSQGLYWCEMLEYRTQLCEQFQLPNGHGRSFGNASLLSGLILTCGDEELKLQCAVSDSSNRIFGEISVGYFPPQKRFNCIMWYGDPMQHLGFYLLGMEHSV